MPRYKYTALAEGGDEVKGEVESISEAAARGMLLRRNLEVTELAKARKKFSEIELTSERVPPTEIMHFSRQLGAFVRAGIPIADGLDAIADSTGSKRWREIIQTMREEIASGVPVSEALEPHADVLPPYYLGIVRSAELTGRLDDSLEQLSEYMERDFETRSKIKSALTYPMVVLALAVVVVVILTAYVLPKFADFFDSLDAQLPLSTRILISFADFSKTNWWIYPIVIGLFIGLILWFWKGEKGRRARDRMMLRLPLVRDIVQYAVVERLCRILGAMSAAAVPLPDAMTAAMRGANNTVYDDGLQAAQERMLEGEGLAAPVEDTGLFPSAAVQMMRVGEDTGTLEQQLENAANFYARELDYRLKRLTTLFEPAVILFMGVLVGFVAVALVQAMYGIYNAPSVQGL
ncbi:MAG: type II secretion system F family protein [Actinomycetota bacterium]